MLTALSIRDIVLVDALDLEFGAGLIALTGETGAGKSILLDALGLALGRPADKGLVRPGAETGSAAAVFDPPADHPVRALLAERGIAADDVLILRRVQSADGRTRAFVNDVPCGVQVLRELGDLLLEIHGQHDDRRLIDPAGHRALLDAFAGHGDLLDAVRSAHAGMVQARGAEHALADEIRAARAEIDWLTHAEQELRALAPEPGEEDRLAADRQTMMAAEKIAGDIADALDAVAGDGGMESRLAAALRRIERARVHAAALTGPIIEALERALTEAAEARRLLEEAVSAIEFEPARLDRIEERLFALRAAARKFSVGVEDLPKLTADLARRLDDLAHGEARLGDAAKATARAEAAYRAAADTLTASRAKAARVLEKAAAREFAPLKLDKAKLRVAIEPHVAEGPEGGDRVVFEVATNPGAPFGPMTKIASGGELSRFILALKVALAETGGASAMIFDEIDRGVGGAVADAIGERLAVLARGSQILVVTHAPQVAARADQHLLIAKSVRGAGTRTGVTRLDAAGRREEIARMLSGAEITDEARAQAGRLLGAV